MSLKDDLTSQVKKIFAEQWKTRDGTVVPDSTKLTLGNDAVKLKAAVLYADLAESTLMVNNRKAYFSAEIYKSFLHCAAKLIRTEGGEITSYDGDRIMGVFIGPTKNTSAARCGLKLNWAVKKIVNPRLRAQYSDTTFTVRHKVGVDSSDLWIARTGVRGANDLVWVGPAANYAAKLTELSHSYATRITHRVYDKMLDEAKTSSTGKPMWEKTSWSTVNGMRIYRSNWTWTVN